MKKIMGQIAPIHITHAYTGGDHEIISKRNYSHLAIFLSSFPSILILTYIATAIRDLINQ